MNSVASSPDFLLAAKTPLLTAILEHIIAYGLPQNADMVIDIWSSRLVRGELDPFAALAVADRYLDPVSATFIAPIFKLRGAALYGILGTLAPKANDWGITHPPCLSDNQYLCLYKGFHSLHTLWDRFRFSPVPDPFLLAIFDPDIIHEWDEKWWELANGSEISNFNETDILGRLRFIRDRLQTDGWSDHVSATTLVGMVDRVIAEVENTISYHF